MYFRTPAHSITHVHSNQPESVSKKATFKWEFIAPIVFVFPPLCVPHTRLSSSMTPSESTAFLLAKSPAVQTAKRANGINNSGWSRPMAFCRSQNGSEFWARSRDFGYLQSNTSSGRWMMHSADLGAFFGLLNYGGDSCQI